MAKRINTRLHTSRSKKTKKRLAVKYANKNALMARKNGAKKSK